ncbi:adenosine deaminase [Ornithinicoccus hortensis]|uniref:Adenosine deaminase n=1 Tax=Ornithinicoccus hortensis TaxID=82346 RepID=A0A542YQ82_9MICO|nr:adenosine deaminase [Ornithinicoccus hortensis]TQL50260.1 adenosine deaminase [Ornithinicoccus hortensis]
MTTEPPTPTTAPSPEQIRALPKALLHDHLDGGLRPQTIIDLADEVGYDGLPATEESALADWFAESADSGSLERYLSTFDQVLAVMQTPEALTRVARECVLDLASDGVVYAELRYAPEQHLRGGLDLDEVVLAVHRGVQEGMEEVAGSGRRPIVARTLLTAMRHAARSREIAELTVRHLGDGVAGFDIAGAEAGFPPSRHLDAFEFLRRENAHFTIHAGEAFGLPSIWEAIQWCGAERLGHGVRLVDDLTLDGVPVTEVETPYAEWTDDMLAAVRLGALAAYVRDRRIPLEMCPSSNLQTGAAPTIAAHPITLLDRLRFRVTLNTDNRLMSRTSMSGEMGLLVDRAGWELAHLRRVTVNALKSAFLPFDERLAIIEDVVKPAYDG